MEQQDLVRRGLLRDPGKEIRELASVSRSSAEHYRWGGANGVVSNGWHLVQTAELSVIEECMPPGAEEVRHFHERARQFFYVLSGELTMELEGEEHRLGAGTGLEIAPGLRHQAFNRSPGEVRFLVISQPRSHGDRLVDA